MSKLELIVSVIEIRFGFVLMKQWYSRIVTKVRRSFLAPAKIVLSPSCKSRAASTHGRSISHDNQIHTSSLHATQTHYPGSLGTILKKHKRFSC